MKKSKESIERTREPEKEMKFIDDYMELEEYKSFIKEDTGPILEFIDELNEDLKKKTKKDFLEAPQDWLKRFPDRLIEEFDKKQPDIEQFILEGKSIVNGLLSAIPGAIERSPELSEKESYALYQIKDIKARALLHELDMVRSYMASGLGDLSSIGRVDKSLKFNSSLQAMVDVFLEIGYRFEMENTKFQELEKEGAEYDKFKKTYYRYINPGLFLRPPDDKYFKWAPSCVEKLDITFPKELAKDYHHYEIDEGFRDNVRTILDFYLAKATEQGKKVELKMTAGGGLELIEDVELSLEEKSFVKRFEEATKKKLILEK